MGKPLKWIESEDLRHRDELTDRVPMNFLRCTDPSAVFGLSFGLAGGESDRLAGWVWMVRGSSKWPLLGPWKILVKARSTMAPGWWFGTFFIFAYIGFLIIPIDELHHFSEGWPNHQPVSVFTTTSIIGFTPHPVVYWW